MAYKIEHRIGIATPVDDVYDIVADIDNWSSWSPIHKSASGRLSFGAVIAFEEYYEGLGTWEISGTLADWVPLSHIHVNVPKRFYEGQLIRYFEFETLSETGSAFTIGALFSGFLSEREGRRYSKFLREGFAAYGEALKAKAEADYAASPDKRRAMLPPPEPKKPQLGPPKRSVVLPQFFGTKKK